MAEYIERNAAIAALHKVRDDQRVFKYATASDFLSARGAIERAAKALESLPAADVAPVRHGRWERCGGDFHSSGYAIYCSICNKTHFVHYKYSLGGLYGCKELFEKPKYCPSCGAFMEFEE